MNKLRIVLIVLVFAMCSNASSLQELDLTETVVEEKPVEVEKPEVILKPRMRPEPLTGVLDYIDTESLTSYFENIVLFDTKEEYEDLPYIFGFDREATMGASGDIAYSLGVDSATNIAAYTILIPGEVFTDPDTGEKLGFYADVIGNGEITRWGNVQTMLITRSITTIDPGSKLIPRIGLDVPTIIKVRYPDTPMGGRVLSVDNDEAGVGTYSVAIINIGTRDGAKTGDLLDLLEAPREIRDTTKHQDVYAPTEKFGKLLIYKTYEKVSLAIVVEANVSVKIGDKIIGTPA